MTQRTPNFRKALVLAGSSRRVVIALVDPANAERHWETLVALFRTNALTGIPTVRANRSLDAAVVGLKLKRASFLSFGM